MMEKTRAAIAVAGVSSPRRSIRPRSRRSLQQVIWSGAYVGTVVPPPATSLLNAPQYLTGKVLGDAAAAYIKDKLGGKANVVLLTHDSLQFLAPRFAAMRDALKDMPGVTIVADISPVTVNKEGGVRDDAAPSCWRIPTSTSCSAPIRSCSARWQRCARPARRGRDQFLGGIDGEPEAVAEIKKGGPYKASISLASPVFGYAMGQHAADWLEGKSIPQAMDILPIALTARQHRRSTRPTSPIPAAVYSRPGAPRRLSQDVRQHLLRHARPVRELSLVVGDGSRSGVARARLPPQHCDRPVRKRQPLRHHRHEIGQQLLAERGVFFPDRVELVRVQHVEHTVDLGLDRRAARGARHQTHLADRGVAAQAADARGAVVFGGDHDADAAVEDEVHGIGGVAGLHDDLAGLDLDALAAADQRVGIVFAAENACEPVVQTCFFQRQALMLRDDLVLAPFQRVIEFGDDGDAFADEVAGAKHLLGRCRQMHQNQLCAEVDRAALDLRKTVGGRGIDAGDELEVEQQIAALRAFLEQPLDVLVEPVGGAEEQIALEIEALDLAAMCQQHVLVVARAVERRAIFGAIETVLDRIRPAPR